MEVLGTGGVKKSRTPNHVVPSPGAKPLRALELPHSQNFLRQIFGVFTAHPSTTTNKMAVVKTSEMDYAIKPEASVPSVDTSDWPLLLKNYEKRTLVLKTPRLTSRH